MDPAEYEKAWPGRRSKIREGGILEAKWRKCVRNEEVVMSNTTVW